MICSLHCLFCWKCTHTSEPIDVFLGRICPATLVLERFGLAHVISTESSSRRADSITYIYQKHCCKAITHFGMFKIYHKTHDSFCFLKTFLLELFNFYVPHHSRNNMITFSVNENSSLFLKTCLLTFSN